MNAGINAALASWTRRLVASLEHDGLQVIVLKGPEQTKWLHGDSYAHHSSDIDLLVAPDQRVSLEVALESRGFLRQPSSLRQMVDPHAPAEWRAPDCPFAVDLHSRLWGVDASPELAWSKLFELRRSDGIPGLVPTAMALHVTLHAAQHGTDDAKARADLSALMTRLDDTQWRDTRDLAAGLEALPAMRAALETSPAGELIASRLKLGVVDIPSHIQLQADGALSETLTLLEIRRTRGLQTRARLLARKVVPPREFMEYWQPESDSRTFGLLRAHGARWMRIARHAPAALRELRRGRG